MIQTNKTESLFDVSDYEQLLKFPARVSGIAVCENGKPIDVTPAEAKQFIQSVGMCRVYYNQQTKKYFALFMMQNNASYIATHSGTYEKKLQFHVFKTDNTMFVFEQDMGLIEEAICAELDVTRAIHQVMIQRRKKQAAEKSIRSFFDFLDHLSNVEYRCEWDGSVDEWDDEDYDECDDDYENEDEDYDDDED